MPLPTAVTPVHRERLTVPLWWWLVAGVFVFSVLVAAGFALGPWPGIALTAVSLLLVVAVLVPYGRCEVSADDEALTVGRSRIEWRWVAGARALDPEATTRRLRTEADVRAHLEIRPYAPRAVEVTLADAADPHPYWLVSSRHPDELAAAVNARAQGGTR